MPIEIQKNIPLSKYATFKIGGPAKYFCVADNIIEIKEALEFAGKNKLKIFILGGGSNLLISDKGFDGIVIKIQDTRYKIQTNNKIFVGAGMSLTKLVNESAKVNLTGLEWAAGIPGTVGGAIHNNSGAFRGSIGDIVEEAEVLEITPQPLPTGQAGPLSRGIGLPRKWDRGVKKFINKQCRFSYRDSIFKKEKKYIILNAVLKLKKGDGEKSRKKSLEYLKSRIEKQPLEYPSAGSVFRNPEVDEICFGKLIKKYPELENIAIKKTSSSAAEIESQHIIPAGWFIEALGLKSRVIGGAMVSDKHGNFIVNINKARAEDAIILICIIKQKIRDAFEIQLREEVEYVGF